MDMLKNMDPQLKRVFENMAKGPEEMDLLASRNRMHEVFQGMGDLAPKNENVREWEEKIPGLGEAPKVRVKVYEPEEAEEDLLPALLFLHAGGFFLGMPEMSDELCRNLAEFVECKVVSVDYRLAPEHPYPAAVEDSYAALEWIFQNSSSLDVDPERIAICGVSAGGCLAAGVALMARDKGTIDPCLQMLLYPVLDHRHVTASSRAIDDSRTWTTGKSKMAWEAYLGDLNGDVPAYASPATSEDLKGLPRTYIAACELDILRDEAVEYARRLYEAEVATELHVLPGTFHAFDAIVPKADISIRFEGEIIHVLQEVFENGKA
ncbi:alpha/beta hydrolase [Alkalibacter rhizosphaerae]|uniref:Alpha/beta hydrolase n=1 Tax=Alkalibacter rhizosphaerae TaxID=2815577 RepID=A0A974XFW2_9FIRM|nr:alpha/beta hydrolase [Alkalibacter rhizosphaerae]QSX07880.1 alpha/beta hydrolase [Alkalibacter rhizosphaerae]